jgi:hypothetical protein
MAGVKVRFNCVGSVVDKGIYFLAGRLSNFRLSVHPDLPFEDNYFHFAKNQESNFFLHHLSR